MWAAVVHIIHLLSFVRSRPSRAQASTYQPTGTTPKKTIETGAASS